MLLVKQIDKAKEAAKENLNIGVETEETKA